MFEVAILMPCQVTCIVSQPLCFFSLIGHVLLNNTLFVNTIHLGPIIAFIQGLACLKIISTPAEE